jgi:hypothetical protein
MLDIHKNIAIKMNTNTLSEQEILDLLNQSVCEVTFKKVDGEIRVMQCTLKENLLPVKTVLTEDTVTKPRVKPPGVVSAWSLDRGDWRSFRVNNVISVVKIANIAG